MSVRPLPAPVEFAETWNRCDATGKTRFTSRGQATKTRCARRNQGQRMRAYFCPDCHGWHLTTHATA